MGQRTACDGILYSTWDTVWHLKSIVLVIKMLKWVWHCKVSINEDPFTKTIAHFCPNRMQLCPDPTYNPIWSIDITQHSSFEADKTLQHH